ncbi:hypothetical protein J2766_001084 [Agrobacterium tumefaciens]|uniref:Uncharacterized protein n=1 Tax=Agrobacterium tumefaciens TaxID=358 RepID=A0AAW8LSP0_AGRTU|nr:hypothetical protein [Agrobacterium tumefaciens]MBP2564525.1 hypothetical protein [Agrobacterium tumefaciens]MDR6701610.1 hypothetical protein [Agrobacterium tumefaciens]
MSEKDAIALDNWFPGESEVTVRPGYREFIGSGLGSGLIETLAGFSSAGTTKMLACTGGNIFEVGSGTPTASLKSGLNNDAWQSVSFGNRTLLFNGFDAELTFDGTVIADAGWSGPPVGSLFAATVFKARVYALRRDTMEVWYGGVGAITGAMTKFDLAFVAGQFGGTVAAIGSLTHDGGAGVDDYLCIMMSTGDTLVYQGSDPADDFALIGVFSLGSPIGRRPMCKLGGELVVLTRDGVMPMSKVISKGRDSKNLAYSDKIRAAVESSLNTYGDTTGWEAVFFPQGNKFILNVPKNNGFQQFVMNASTKAWCRYTGINARTWILWNDEVYFGGTDGKIYKAETGLDDNGDVIQVFGMPAYSALGSRGSLKLVSAVKINFRSSGKVQINLSVNTDYKRRTKGVTFFTQATSGTEWNAESWNSFSWGGGEVTRGKWKMVAGRGYVVNVAVTASPRGQTLSWQDTGFIFNRAGML